MHIPGEKEAGMTSSRVSFYIHPILQPCYNEFMQEQHKRLLN